VSVLEQTQQVLGERESPASGYARRVTADTTLDEAASAGLPVLRTSRLVVRPLAHTDRERCRAVLAPRDEDAFARWFAWAVAAPAALADLRQPPYGERAIVHAASGELVGLTGLVPSHGPFAQLEGAPAGGTWEPEFGLYWALSPQHRGRGFATEAAAALSRALLTTLRAKRLIATSDYSNLASQAVMRRLGMTLLTNPYSEPSWLQVVGILDAKGTPRR
jgi:RimJ/RimL family protein N-acetyltransferase